MILPSSRGQWLIPLALVIGLVWAVQAWASARGEAELLEQQLEVALDSLEVAEEGRDIAIAATDSVIEQNEVIAAEAEEAIAEAIENTEAQQREAESAFRRAEALAADNPVLEQAIQEMRAEAIVVEMAFEEERETAAAALLAAQGQITSLTTTLLAEREASNMEIARLNTALSLAIEEGEAWERAANPGFFTDLWKQGRAALVAVAIVLAVK